MQEIITRENSKMLLVDCKSSCLISQMAETWNFDCADVYFINIHINRQLCVSTELNIKKSFLN